MNVLGVILALDLARPLGYKFSIASVKAVLSATLSAAIASGMFGPSSPWWLTLLISVAGGLLGLEADAAGFWRKAGILVLDMLREAVEHPGKDERQAAMADVERLIRRLPR